MSTLVKPAFLFLVLLATPMAIADDPTTWVADPNVVAHLTTHKGGFNYDEAKVPPYELPNPLVAMDGSAITTSDQWQSVRRGELLELFREVVYGHRPHVQPRVRFEVIDRREECFSAAALGQTVLVHLVLGKRTKTFPMTVFIPTATTRRTRVPAVVAINNREFISLETACRTNNPFWPVESIVRRGYATVTFFTSDVDPDSSGGYPRGIRGFLDGVDPSSPSTPPASDAWGALSAWGWAASRAMDYLETLPEIDAQSVAVVGHSRGGKAALWAAAEDPRFAIAYSNNSGCGGAALSRRVYGETVARITENFPHWFCGSFSHYGGREAELPIDQHELIAVIAPRAVYVASADEDLWADPVGEYASLVAAAPVFQLLGKAAIADPTMPPLNQPRINGATGYHIRGGGHGLEEVDWEHFLAFADQAPQFSTASDEGPPSGANR